MKGRIMHRRFWISVITLLSLTGMFFFGCGETIKPEDAFKDSVYDLKMMPAWTELAVYLSVDDIVNYFFQFEEIERLLSSPPQGQGFEMGIEQMLRTMITSALDPFKDIHSFLLTLDYPEEDDQQTKLLSYIHIDFQLDSLKPFLEGLGMQITEGEGYHQIDLSQLTGMPDTYILLMPQESMIIGMIGLSVEAALAQYRGTGESLAPCGLYNSIVNLSTTFSSFWVASQTNPLLQILQEESYEVRDFVEMFSGLIDFSVFRFGGLGIELNEEKGAFLALNLYYGAQIFSNEKLNEYKEETEELMELSNFLHQMAWITDENSVQTNGGIDTGMVSYHMSFSKSTIDAIVKFIRSENCGTLLGPMDPRYEELCAENVLTEETVNEIIDQIADRMANANLDEYEYIFNDLEPQGDMTNLVRDELYWVSFSVFPNYGISSTVWESYLDNHPEVKERYQQAINSAIETFLQRAEEAGLLEKE